MRFTVNRKFFIGTAALAVALGLGLVAWLARQAGDARVPDADARAPSVLTVEVVAPQTQNWPQTLQASGPVTAWQEVIVSPETGGLRIAELLVDVGASVKRGQLLARLADATVKAEVRKQEAAVAQARASLDQAVSNTRRAKIAESSGALSAQKIEEYRITEATSRASLASAQAELDSSKLKLIQTRIVAADDGIVSSKSAVLGNVVSAGAELFRLVRQAKVEWRPELDARQVALVRVGQIARVTLPGGEQVEGKVRLVGPTLSTTTGRGTVYASLPAASASRSGMFANGTLELDAKSALTLPQSAIVMRDGRSYVYVVGSGDKVSSHPVATGRRQGDRIEVLSGLAGDARVVAGGGAFLSEGVQVTVAGAAKAQAGGSQ
jgi:RND family efflux transporter MFP subunit